MISPGRCGSCRSKPGFSAALARLESSSVCLWPSSESQCGIGLSLTADARYEILLRIPTKDLCRCRAVCQRWRCLLDDPHFIAGYSTYRQNTPYDIMDLSGMGGSWVTSVHLNIICVSNARTFRLLNLSTGAVYDLPEELTEEYAAEERNTCRFHASAAFGQVSSTGQYKVLRVLDRFCNDHEGQLFEIFTLGGGSHARWRAKETAPYAVMVDQWKSVVIYGIVYFFGIEHVALEEDAVLGRIASFDLETEKWMPTVQGPLSNSVDALERPYPRFDTVELSLCAINGCVVVIHRTPSLVDLWFLMDFERGLWVKRHSLQVKIIPDIFTHHIRYVPCRC